MLKVSLRVVMPKAISVYMIYQYLYVYTSIYICVYALYLGDVYSGI